MSIHRAGFASCVSLGLALGALSLSTGCIFAHPHSNQQDVLATYKKLNAPAVEARRQRLLAEPEHDAARVPPNWNREWREGYAVALNAYPTFMQAPFSDEQRDMLKAYIISPGWVYDRDLNGQVKQRMFAIQVYYKITNGELAGRCYGVQANVRQDRTLGSVRHFEPPQMDTLGSPEAIRVSCAAVEALP